MLENKYTNSVLNVIQIAHELAKSKKNQYIGTEHLLYGLAKEEGIASDILLKYGITSELVINHIISSNNRKSIIPESNKYKEVFSIAEECLEKVDGQKLGTEFILFAIMKQSESTAIDIISKNCNNFQGLFNELLKLINDNNKNPDALYNQENSALLTYGNNLNELVKLGKIEKLIGREKELDRLIQILGRKTKNNPCIIGDAGVGKTAIVEGLAYNIVNGNVPKEMKDKQIISLDLSAMIAGSKYRGEFEDRIKSVLEEVELLPQVILFIDELHTIIGAGSGEGTLDVANILKPVLARGEVRVIGATTIAEYRKHIEKDEALARRFQKLLIEEPSKDETIFILNGIKENYEKFHGVKIPEDVINYIVDGADRYINNRFFPDKAIDLLDETCTYCKGIQNSKTHKVNSIESQYSEAIQNDDINELIKLTKKIDTKKANENKNVYEITAQDVAKVLSKIANIPVDEISKDEITKLKDLEKDLKTLIIGQDEAITLLSKAVKRGRSGIKDPKKPIGSFLFLGPTGCGKTETCKALAKLVFNSEDDIIRFDMSEYMEKHSVSKLIGSPPGYVGYEEGGQLTEKVSKKPYSIVLFDEIEKAHPDIFNILLQVLDEGSLTDSNGRKVSFKNTIIVLTSNIGAKELFSNKHLGFNSKEDLKEDTKKNVMSEVKKSFNPEFINRLDEIVIFNKLSKEDIFKIADILINQTINRISSKIDIKIEDTLKNQIVNEGFSEEYGARPLKRAIVKYIENPVADYIIEHGLKSKKVISVGYIDNEVKIKSIKS